MARIRTIKPDFWEDRRLARDLTRDQRLFYIGLWNQADDAGRFLAHPRRLLGAIFPYDEDLPGTFVSDALSALATTGRIMLYEIDGEPYGQLTKFAEHQRINRPTASKIPAPDGSMSPHGALTEGSPPEEEEDVGKEREKEKEEDARPADRLSDVEKSISEIIMTCNKGMSENPNLRKNFEPILTNGSSRQTVSEWLDEGIPAELCRRVVFERARAYRPNERNRQISSLRYLNNAVRDEWARQQSGGVPSPQTAKPSPGSEADRVRNEAPYSGGKRAAGLRTVAGEKLESQSEIDERRVNEWAKAHAEAAAVIHQECVEEIAALPHADMLSLTTMQLMVKSKFRERVLAEKLTPRLAS